MGYESKIYFCKDYGVPYSRGYSHSEIVAMIDMGKMGYEKETQDFVHLFNKETPFDLYLEDYDEDKEIECMKYLVDDKYGDRICYADINELLEQLDKVIEVNKKWPDYKRFKQLKAMLKAFKSDPEIYVVHYGY